MASGGDVSRDRYLYAVLPTNARPTLADGGRPDMTPDFRYDVLRALPSSPAHRAIPVVLAGPMVALAYPSRSC